MKVIDLLNKIANGEKIPKEMRIKGCEHSTNDEYFIYQIYNRLFKEDYDLNDEVEIIEEEPYVEVCGRWFTKSEYDNLFRCEEEKKIPEKLDKYADISGNLACEWTFGEKKLKDKINEIIDYLDYLKSKGE